MKNVNGEGVLISEGWMLGTQKIKYWKYYSSEGLLQSEGHYRENKRSDYWFFYHPSGKVKQEGRFLNGKMNGLWSYYSVKGELVKKCQYQLSRKDGYCVLYEGSEPIKAERFEDGKRTGEWTNYLKFMADNPQWLREKP